MTISNQGTNEMSGIPRIAIVGRINVGKSTLFNRLIGKRRTITDRTPGVTRDPIDEVCTIDGEVVVLIDTGGFKTHGDPLDKMICSKSLAEAKSSDLILFLVEVNELVQQDYEYLEQLRPFEEKLILVVNKVDDAVHEDTVWNFYKLGIKHVISISAAHGRNIQQLRQIIASRIASTRITSLEPSIKSLMETDKKVVRIAIMGKPNTGKSTLTNLLIGEQKSLVFEAPGTTRDVVEGTFCYDGYRFIVLDTAGIRRKRKVVDNVEYYSVNRAIGSIDDVHVIFLLIDALEGLTEQDKKIASLVTNKGRGVCIVINKWDLLKHIPNHLQAMQDRIRFLFPVLEFAPVLAISALQGYGIRKLCQTTIQIVAQLNKRIDTSILNDCLQKWIHKYPLPVRNRNVKIRYATQIGTNPIRFLFFVNRLKIFPYSYTKYLINRIKEDLGFNLVPIDIVIRES